MSASGQAGLQQSNNKLQTNIIKLQTKLQSADQAVDLAVG